MVVVAHPDDVASYRNLALWVMVVWVLGVFARVSSSEFVLDILIEGYLLRLLVWCVRQDCEYVYPLPRDMHCHRLAVAALVYHPLTLCLGNVAPYVQRASTSACGALATRCVQPAFPSSLHVVGVFLGSRVIPHGLQYAVYARSCCQMEVRPPSALVAQALHVPVA